MLTRENRCAAREDERPAVDLIGRWSLGVDSKLQAALLWLVGWVKINAVIEAMPLSHCQRRHWRKLVSAK